MTFHSCPSHGNPCNPCTPIYVEQMFKFLSIKIEVGQYALPEHSNSGYVSLRLNFMHICMYIP